MSKSKNSGLDQYGAEPFEWQQFGTAGVEGVNRESFTTQIHSTPRMVAQTASFQHDSSTKELSWLGKRQQTA